MVDASRMVAAGRRARRVTPGRILVALAVDRFGPAPPVAELARRLKVTPGSMADPLAEMAESGIVAVWQDGEGTLRVCRVSAGEEVERIASRSRRQSINGRGVVLESELGVDIHSIADPDAEQPAEVVGAAEAEVAGFYRREYTEYQNRKGQTFRTYAGPPRPRMFLGLDVAWDAGPIVPASCPGCEGKPLGKVVYCLCCDRFGFDGAAPPPATDGVRAKLVSDRLAGGIGGAEGRKVSSKPEETKAKGKGAHRGSWSPARRETRAERIERLKKLMESRRNEAIPPLQFSGD